MNKSINKAYDNKNSRIIEWETLEDSVLNKIYALNLSPQGSGNSEEEEVERLLRAKGDGRYQGNIWPTEWVPTQSGLHCELQKAKPT